MQHPAVLTLLERFGSPAQIRKAGRRRLVTLLRPKTPRMAERLVEDIFGALDEQSVTVPGTDAAALIVPRLATSLTAVLDQRRWLAGRIEELLEAHPLSKTPHGANSSRCRLRCSNSDRSWGVSLQVESSQTRQAASHLVRVVEVEGPGRVQLRIADGGCARGKLIAGRRDVRVPGDAQHVLTL